MWLIPLLATIEGGFPFYDILIERPPALSEPDFQLYFGSQNPKIYCSKIAHFALGTFWKASAHSWRGNTSEPLIELGPYREPLRLFLQDEAPFPKEMALTVGVARRPVKFIAANAPYRGSGTEYHGFYFYVPGILFNLSVGKKVVATLKSNCFLSHSAHPIIITDVEESAKSATKLATASAHIQGKVLERWKNYKITDASSKE